MPFQLIDSSWYMMIIGILAVISLFSFFRFGVNSDKEKKTKRKLKKTKKNNPNRKVGIANLEKKIKKERRRKTGFLIMGSVCVLGSFLMLFFKGKYGKISEEFHPVKKYGQFRTEVKNGELFKVEIRDFTSQEEWAEKAAHLDWYYEVFSEENNYVNLRQIDEYQTRVDMIHKEPPHKKDIYIVEDSRDFVDEGIVKLQMEEEERLYSVFNAAVGVPIAGWESEELWKAYNAGEELSKKNNTSAMVFQTAVLAEGAHGNLYEKSRGGEDSLQYLAGAIKYFEEFLEFEERDAGNDTMVSVCEVCFREGKMDYREGTCLKGKEQKNARHFLVKAYAEFQFSLENTTMEDNKYLTCLYYAGLSCLRIMSYVNDDEELQYNMCREIVEKWDTFYDRYSESLESIKVENISREAVDDVKNNLESYIYE